MESYVIYVKDNSFAQNGKQYLRESIKEHTPLVNSTRCSGHYRKIANRKIHER